MVKRRITGPSSFQGGIPSGSPAGPAKRKRSVNDNASGTSSSKRPWGSTTRQSRDRSRTPSTKNARFQPGLIMGPTPGDPVRGRSQSPTRSALHKRDDHDDGPSAQLRVEHDASLDCGTTPRLQPGSRKPSFQRKRSPAGREAHGNRGRTGDCQVLNHMSIQCPTSSANRGPSRCRVRAVDLDDDVEEPLVRSKSTVAADEERLSILADGQLTDDDVCRRLDRLRSDAMALAKMCPPVPPKRKHDLLDKFLVQENERLIRYIGCLAMGGPTGVAGWNTLLGDTTCRQALVLGIIGRSLKENVFSELYFGGGETLSNTLREQEQKQTHQDGFFRTQERARTINKHKPKQADNAIFRKAVVRITLQLESLLLPLWAQSPGTAQVWYSSGNREKLAAIVTSAAQLSRSLRAVPNVVYYWPPTFKDEEFEPGRMECLNLKAMISESPYDKKTINGMERAVLRDGHEHESEAIVRVVCFPGMVAYRQHGGALAEQELEDEENARRERDGRGKLPPDVQMRRRMLASQEKSLTGDEGFRTRVISKSVVLLQWGKQRLLTKEAGTSRHIDAMKGKGGGTKKYEDDHKGFKELYQLYELKLQSGQGSSSIYEAVTGWLSRSPSASLETASRQPG